MEELNSSLLILNNTSKDPEYTDNITISQDESNQYSNATTGYELTNADIAFVTLGSLVSIFGPIGNILSFIVMRRGSLKDVSTCFYMSILALADTGESLLIYTSLCVGQSNSWTIDSNNHYCFCCFY